MNIFLYNSNQRQNLSVNNPQYDEVFLEERISVRVRVSQTRSVRLSQSESQSDSSNKALVFFSRLCFGLYIRKTGRNTGENVTGISRDNR
ncbi:hypothetical protein T02_1739 [Trichinella nativa]|uniref:Uncharacterized protein n=1 Tax=Trichinella nativa TaxID=6335 RepID=A0A0V1KR99_9BILA|nr:hypothetical protein T02_1739 [Trichinella nativa]